jgi:hypothetical protein
MLAAKALARDNAVCRSRASSRSAEEDFFFQKMKEQLLKHFKNARCFGDKNYGPQFSCLDVVAEGT